MLCMTPVANGQKNILPKKRERRIVPFHGTLFFLATMTDKIPHLMRGISLVDSGILSIATLCFKIWPAAIDKIFFWMTAGVHKGLSYTPAPYPLVYSCSW